MARYLVTGATGFLGRHTAAALRARGHEVVGLARSVPADGAEGLRWRRGDVLDKSSVRSAAEGCEGVLHCAGLVSRDPADAEKLRRLHVEGTRAVLEAAREAGAKRVVVASTSGTLGISETPRPIAREDSAPPMALLQRFPYYRAKLFAEREALERNAPGFEVLCVNPSLLLGPGDLLGSSTEDVRRFLDRQVPFVPQGGVAFVDARDAGEAMALALEKGRGGQRYLVNGANMTVREFFERLERVSGVKGPRLPVPGSASLAGWSARLLARAVKTVGGELPVDATSAEMAQLFWYVDASKAERELGWKPRDPTETLADTVRDLRGER